MEEQATTAINQLIDTIQVALVPLAVSGLAAWLSTVLPSSGPIMKIIDAVGGNVGKASNDPGKQ